MGASGGMGVGAGVAFVGVLEGDGYFRLAARNDGVGDADGRALPNGAKVRVQVLGAPNPVDERIGLRMDGEGGDIGVPGVVGRKD